MGRSYSEPEIAPIPGSNLCHIIRYRDPDDEFREALWLTWSSNWDEEPYLYWAPYLGSNTWENTPARANMLIMMWRLGRSDGLDAGAQALNVMSWDSSMGRVS